MSQNTELDQELERRLVEIETEEANDAIHAALGGRTIAVFLAGVAVIAGASWAVSAL